MTDKLTFKKLLMISRPALWIIFPAIFYAGIRYSGADLTFLTTLITIYLSFPIALAGHIINDIFDYEIDKRNPRKKSFVYGAVVEPKHHKKLHILAFLLAIPLFLLVLMTGSIVSVLCLLGIGFIAYFYSAPPIRLKDKGPLDSISNGVAYFFLTFLMGYSIEGNLSSIPAQVYWLTLWVIGFHALTTIVDYDFDKKVGTRTFAVRFGKRFTAMFGFLVFLSCFLFGPFAPWLHYSFLMFTMITLPIVIWPNPKFLKYMFYLIGFLVILVIVGQLFFKKFLGL